MSAHFLSKCSGLQEFPHLRSSAFHRIYDNHKNSFLPLKRPRAQFSGRIPNANFHQFSEEDLFTQKWDNNFYFPEAQIRRENEPDNLKMHQIGQSQNKLPTQPMQSDLSDLRKVELNYNEDDQKLLEEMLNLQDGRNLLEEMLNSQDNQEASIFQLPFSSESTIFLKESHVPGAIEDLRTSALDYSKYNKKNDNSIYSVKKKKTMFGVNTKKIYKTSKAELKKNNLKLQKEELVSILTNNFSIDHTNKEQHDEVYVQFNKNSKSKFKQHDEESESRRSLDMKVLQYLGKADREENALNFRDGTLKSSRALSSAPNAAFKRCQTRTFKYIKCMQWEGSVSFNKEISDLVGRYKDSKKANPRKSFSGRIRDISTVGVTVMKIISKLHSKRPRSEEFGDNQKILEYTEDFWKNLFSDKEIKADDLVNFCKSMGAKSVSQMEKCLLIQFTSQNQGLLESAKD
ncbi:hypothetical protein BY996DRAFT_6510922 [Phakopsora pachyrhizi]|nr:hypothetical protein BY996DRAFT_6510922 [Phakopsora pachyrhizi]